jgi:hypothetical protein
MYYGRIYSLPVGTVVTSARYVCRNNNNNNNNNKSVMDLGHLLTRSGLTCPEASSKVCHGFFCQSGSSVSLPWVICYKTFCLGFTLITGHKDA